MNKAYTARQGYAKRLGPLEGQNGDLKKLLTEQMLDNAMLRDINAKNGDARSLPGRRFGKAKSAERGRVMFGKLIDPGCGICHAVMMMPNDGMRSNAYLENGIGLIAAISM